MDEQAQAFARDIEWLNSQRERFVSVSCPTCGDNGEPAWAKHGLDYLRCKCGTVYASPRPSVALLRLYYRRSESYAYWNEVVFPASEEARRRIFRERAQRIGQLASGTLVDVGAGYGTFCEEASAHFETIALEPEPHLAETCRAKGITTIEESVECADLPHVDVITAFEVIEHLFSPREFIRRCAGWLSPKGLLVLTCPNVEGFEIEVLGSRSKAVDPEHLNLMCPRSLRALMESEGFEVIQSETPGRLDCELAGVRDGGLQDFLVASGRSSHMWVVGRKR